MIRRHDLSCVFQARQDLCHAHLATLLEHMIHHHCFVHLRHQIGYVVMARHQRGLSVCPLEVDTHQSLFAAAVGSALSADSPAPQALLYTPAYAAATEQHSLDS